MPARARPVVGPNAALAAGVAMVAAFIAQSSLILLALECVAFWLLARAAGKRIKPFYFLGLAFFVAFFELLAPRGLALFAVLGFRVTDEALRAGVVKGLTIAGSVLGSLAAIRRELRLPGRAGWFLSQVLVRFDAIMAAKRRVKADDVVGSLDALLFELFPPERFGEAGDAEAAPPERTNLAGALVLAATAAPFLLALPLARLMPL